MYDHGRFPEILKETWYGHIRKPRQLTQIDIMHDATTGAIKNVLNKINTLNDYAVGRRMTRSDYDQKDILELEEKERIKRVSMLDFTNGYEFGEGNIGDMDDGEGGEKGKEQKDNKDNKDNKDRRGKTEYSTETNHTKKSDYEDINKSIMLIQKLIRGHQTRSKIEQGKQIEARTRHAQAKNIQTIWRQHVYYLRCIVLVQAVFRAIPIREEFLHVQECCIQIQSLYRGGRCRNHSYNQRRSEVQSLRTHILRGWDACHVPLLQRSRFWIRSSVVNSGIDGGLRINRFPTYLDVGIHRDEMNWLNRKQLEYDLKTTGESKNNINGHGNSNINGNDVSFSPPSYPNEVSTLKEAKKALDKSRKDLYWRFKGKKKGTSAHPGLKKERLREYFIYFDLENQKKRKQKLSNMVWSGWALALDAVAEELFTKSAKVVLACAEETDEDWIQRWRSHRIRVNVLGSLRGSLVALQGMNGGGVEEYSKGRRRRRRRRRRKKNGGAKSKHSKK